MERKKHPEQIVEVECPICLGEFGKNLHPFSLQCGHNLCEKDMKSLIKKDN